MIVGDDDARCTSPDCAKQNSPRVEVDRVDPPHAKQFVPDQPSAAIEVQHDQQFDAAKAYQLLKKLLCILRIGDFSTLDQPLLQCRDHQAMRRMQGARGLCADIIRDQDGFCAERFGKGRKLAD